GGATANNLLMQFQADLLNCKVIRPEVTEVTAIGAAYLAGLATGFWDSIEQIRAQWKINKTFVATEGIDNTESIRGWKRAVKAARVNAED
ncbi:MAG: glycerol kinase, partial [Pedobacter sp.]